MPLIAVATWKFGLGACRETYRNLAAGASALDAVEKGVRVTEEDLDAASVGLGGRPNADGIVELDAAVMCGPGRRYGAVAGIRDIGEAISVARLVMEKTPHNLLVGEGARQFAVEQGFKPRWLLTEHRRLEWEEWKRSRGESESSHDTVCVLALDGAGGLCAGTSTSGIAYKLPGRVGDTPLVGCGLYCDQLAGAAAATGPGEVIMRYVVSFRIVEEMRRGAPPHEACLSALGWIASENPRTGEQPLIGVIALNPSGEWGAAGSQPGFPVAIATSGGTELIEAVV
ncbi:MAG: N(4)-(beta-N-acetylglucosaminyl)-L-asparaginase [Armatimonadota bacterium]|nr:N(4)-(beta-N-acetylglucosaminyl)-L-asparaginase [Armatimonadota bacterium]